MARLKAGPSPKASMRGVTPGQIAYVRIDTRGVGVKLVREFVVLAKNFSGDGCRNWQLTSGFCGRLAFFLRRFTVFGAAALLF